MPFDLPIPMALPFRFLTYAAKGIRILTLTEQGHLPKRSSSRVGYTGWHVCPLLDGYSRLRNSLVPWDFCVLCVFSGALQYLNPEP